MRKALPALIPLLATSAFSAEDSVDFLKHIKPILESTCINCHDEEEAKGDVQFHTKETALNVLSEAEGHSLVPGDPEQSGIYWTTVLPEDDDLIMPPKGNVLAKSQTDKIKAWIEGGAPWPDGVVLKSTPRIEFVKNIQPILEQNCVSCHKPDKDEGGWEITTREAAFSTGDNAPNIVPFDAEKSALYFLCALDADDDDLMPPAKQGGPLPKSEIAMLRDWVAQGAIWPEDVKLTQRAKGDTGQPESPDNLELVRKIHAKIVATSTEKAESEMSSYTGTASLASDEPFEMVAIPSGEFTMGSPDSEASREADEGPQRKIKIAPFWMGKTEVTWNTYEPFQVTPIDRYKDGARKVVPDGAKPYDVISQPTTPYVEMTFGMGQKGFPAISMTQHAALKYCQWLSAQTGHFYRLPTEAEWEYACRAGTTTAYSFGDDPAKLDEFAWHWENAEDKYQPAGTKKPNPWGLHDMHGNVMEWVIDAYTPNYPTPPTTDDSGAVWEKPTELYPRVARGGGWDSDPEELRSANRESSSEGWKVTDPQLPQSIWYHTDAQWLGFRVVRPLKIPTAEEMYEYWNGGRPKD